MSDKKDPAMNALKHGILSEAVVVHSELSEHTREDQADFDAILSSLVSRWLPQGPIEEMLCEKIAVTYWRLRRVLWFESGQIADGVTLGSEQALQATQGLEDEASDLQDRAHAIQRSGRLSKAELQVAQEYFGRKSVKPDEWASMLSMWARKKESEAAAYYTRKTHHTSAPNFGDERWDTAMRYEAHLNRQIHRDIKMLADIQATRLAAQPGAGRKPRRGASRGKPAFLHVVGGR